LSLMCGLFGHKWRNGTCIRCSKTQSEYDEKSQKEEKTNEDILPTGNIKSWSFWPDIRVP